MNKKDFKNISMTGRIAYQLMCAERYFINKYPNENFKELFSILWPVTDGMYFDTFSNYITELKPTYMLEKENYEDDDWLVLTKEQYELLKPLIQKLDQEDEDLMDTLKDQAEVYAYSVVPKNTNESIDIIYETMKYLKKYNIDLPDIKLLEFSSITQKNGWGDSFDGSKLSIIIK